MGYTSGRTVKSNVKRPTTVAKATADARRIVKRVMPDVQVTVESRLSHDLATDTPTVITTVTFPIAHANAYDLGEALESLPNVTAWAPGSGRYTITRAR